MTLSGEHYSLLSVLFCGFSVASSATYLAISGFCRFLGEYCKSLQGLQVRECRDVTEISLARLRAKSIRVDVPIPRRFLPSDITRQMGGLSLQI